MDRISAFLNHFHRRPAALFAGILAMLFAGIAQAGTSSPLTLTVQPRGIVVEGVTPGGTVVVFARARKQILNDYAESVGMKFLLRDKTSSGRVSFDAGKELPSESVWTIVDLSTGRHLIERRGNAAKREFLSPQTVRYRPQDHGKLRLQLSTAEVLVVRKGEAAWNDMVSDGGPSDEDQRLDGVMICSPAKLKDLRRNSNGKVDRVKKGDLVVVLDPVTLRVWSSSEIGE